MKEEVLGRAAAYMAYAEGDTTGGEAHCSGVVMLQRNYLSLFPPSCPPLSGAIATRQGDPLSIGQIAMVPLPRT